ncbi:MAG: hypothetical protein NT024_13875, partial [Proteobacteria bacterium]|nr:hypothetical protein [Pseudomonadota bacterium]
MDSIERENGSIFNMFAHIRAKIGHYGYLFPIKRCELRRVAALMTNPITPPLAHPQRGLRQRDHRRHR